MSLDISVKIRNYIASDTYTVNIYRQGSNIAVATKDVAVNAGSTVEFKNLMEGYSYDAEVVHHCTTKDSTKRIPVAATGTVTCNCPTGYTANDDKTKCVKVLTEQPTIAGDAYPVALGPDEASYCREGINVYGPGFGQNGKGAMVYQSGNAHSYWASLNSTTNGRLNIAGVWNGNDTSLPLNTWIGFSKTINVPTSKVYYVAIAGDNYVRIKVNGAVIVDQRLTIPEPTNGNFNYWHCYPVFLNAGTNVIETEGYNDASLGCFAAEIYNCTLDDLKNVTTATESTLGRIFSTMDQTYFTNNYSCRDGYALDTTGTSPVCKKIEYQACS